MQFVSVSDPLLAPTWVTAVFTIVLAVGAVVTAVFAFLAFRKHSDALAVLRTQASDQQATNAKLAAAAELQAQELRKSLDEREQAREERHRGQASRVFIWQEVTPPNQTTAHMEAAAGREMPLRITAMVTNDSDQPIYGVQVLWHRESAPEGEPDTVPERCPARRSSRSANSLPVPTPTTLTSRSGSGTPLACRGDARATEPSTRPLALRPRRQASRCANLLCQVKRAGQR
jgi:hypothetical protein